MLVGHTHAKVFTSLQEYDSTANRKPSLAIVHLQKAMNTLLNRRGDLKMGTVSLKEITAISLGGNL